MKLKTEPARVMPRKRRLEAATETGVPKGMRRLKWNELVHVGDFVADERRGIETWEGPSGFRADSFEKAIYRQNESLAPATKKSK
jgi:hypothetical protein